MTLIGKRSIGKNLTGTKGSSINLNRKKTLPYKKMAAKIIVFIFLFFLVLQVHRTDELIEILDERK